jgi:hypothetical protein
MEAVINDQCTAASDQWLAQMRVLQLDPFGPTARKLAQISAGEYN